MSVEAPPLAPHPTTDGYRMVRPGPLLRPFVETLWVHTIPAEAPDVRLLPDGRMNMVWSSQWGLWLAGPQSHWLNRPVIGPAVVVGARFRPGAAPALLRLPARELVDDRASLSAIDPGLTRRLERRLEGARFEAEALDAYNRELGRRLREPPELDPVVLEAVDLLGEGKVPVSEVADRVYVSERQLQRRFHERIGYGPKTLQRIFRFQDAVDRLRTGAAPAQVAAQAGYADQSHLFRESRRLAGLSPRELVDAGH